MAYDEDVAERIRAALGRTRGVTEKRMFGGLAFLVRGHMAVAAAGRGGLMVRVNPDDTDDLVAAEGVERMVMRGRAMNGWLYVDGSALSGGALDGWVKRGVDFVRALPPK